MAVDLSENASRDSAMDSLPQTEEQIAQPEQQPTPSPTPPPQPLDMTVRKAEPLRFLGLAKELQHLIIGFVLRPTDLRTCALVCKQFHELAIKRLYREVSLEVGSPDDTRLTAFCNPRNAGIKHMKKLDLYLADVADKCNQHHQANLAIRMLIEFLPEDALEKFSWHPWTPFAADNLLMLFKKQRRMQWMEAISLDRNALPELEKLSDFDDRFKHVRKLGLYPDSREVLDMCAALVKRSKKLEKITLHASFDDGDERSSPISNRELNDSSTAPGLITSTIFGHLMPFETCTPMTLRDFTLQKINLRYAADTYCQFIDFRNLKALRVFGCPGADSLFAQLSKATRLPESLETLEFKHEDNSENEALQAVDGFLCLATGIKILTLDICYSKQLPASAGIARHGRTLKELNVHASRGDGEEEELVYDAEDFEKICKSCSSIEQLSIGFPATSLIRPNSDAFQSFENALADLPELITLNITTWPTNTPSTSRLPRKTYEVLLQSLAQAGFERSLSHAASLDPPRSSKLAIIAFGSSDKVYDREDSKNQIIYVKGKQVDAFGKESPLAVKIGWCLRKYIVPRSEVLDFSLARSCGPPTREPPRNEDNGPVDNNGAW